MSAFRGQTLGHFLTRERLLDLWVLTLTLSAGGLCAGLLAAGYRIHQPLAVAVLAALALLAEHESIKLTPER